MTNEERIARGLAVLAALPSTGATWDLVLDQLRAAGVFEFDVDMWEHCVALRILEEYNRRRNLIVRIGHALVAVPCGVESE